MYRRLGVAMAHSVEVTENLVGDEGCEGRSQLHYGLQAGVEGLICSQLVVGHTATPETLAVQTYIPVREIFVHEVLNGACCGCGVVVVKILRYILHQRVQYRDNPTVNLGTLRYGNFALAACEAIHVGVECKE